jgi:hypothetical protein
LKDRNGAVRRIQTIEEATKLIQFWQAAKQIRKELKPSEAEELDAEFLRRLSEAEKIVALRGTYRDVDLGELLGNLASILFFNSLFIAAIVWLGENGLHSFGHAQPYLSLAARSLAILLGVATVYQVWEAWQNHSKTKTHRSSLPRVNSPDV